MVRMASVITVVLSWQVREVACECPTTSIPAPNDLASGGPIDQRSRFLSEDELRAMIYQNFQAYTDTVAPLRGLANISAAAFANPLPGTSRSALQRALVAICELT